MGDLTVGGLTLDEHEQRTYIVVQEAVKEAITPINHELHGKDGHNGLQTKVRVNTDGIIYNKKMVFALYGFIGTAVVGVVIGVVTYILTCIR